MENQDKINIVKNKTYTLTFNGVVYQCETLKEISNITNKNISFIYRLLNNKK